MPPFRLEAFRSTEYPKRRQQILYNKKQYNRNVKVTDWEMYLESYPRDNDPYCPGKLNYSLSHYNRLGAMPDEPFQSETSRMLSELYEKQVPTPELNKYLINFYSYSNECSPKEALICPTDVRAADYHTTMQTSYTMPFPYQMQRFALPTTPFMKHRKIKTEQIEHCTTKFLDDGFKKGTCQLHDLKKSHWISYNPCTGLDSDGNPIKTKERKCVMLEY